MILFFNNDEMWNFAYAAVIHLLFTHKNKSFTLIKIAPSIFMQYVLRILCPELETSKYWRKWKNCIWKINARELSNCIFVVNFVTCQRMISMSLIIIIIANNKFIFIQIRDLMYLVLWYDENNKVMYTTCA